MTALLELRGIVRTYAAGESEVHALRNIDLRIHAGEMVAVVGASGSGKSTLMNVLGCLDRPSSGQYRIAGRDVASLDKEALARLRRERFGFIFQRYHLLSQLNAVDNVEMPAVYAGVDQRTRHARASELLARLGLADRLHHRPNQLSGGQQQRVSIARALMNGGEIILADEPTGALDSESGREMMKILHDLHRHGHTVIIVTHDHTVAAHAERIIELRDGNVVRDTGSASSDRQTARFNQSGDHASAAQGSFRSRCTRLLASLKLALSALRANKSRSLLTMLGIVIGITSVVSVVALSAGAKNSVLGSVKEFASSKLVVWPGQERGDDRGRAIHPLTAGDMAALGTLQEVAGVTPQLNTNVRLRHGNLDVNAFANGSTEDGMDMFNLKLSEGRNMTEAEILGNRQVAIIDDNVRRKLFSAREGPIGKTILVGPLPCTVIGVAGRRKGAMDMLWNDGANLQIWLPHTTLGSKLLGRRNFDAVTVLLRDGTAPAAAESKLTRFLEMRHGGRDFFISNLGGSFDKVEQIGRTMTLGLSLIAAISLAVGGVGVMNIMLVSVTERTHEIGIRMAVGARPGDVQRQFLIEALLLCLMGGLIGVALTFVIVAAVALTTDLFRMEVSWLSILAAFATSSLIGIFFGFWPARKAAALDPIQALARE